MASGNDNVKLDKYGIRSISRSYRWLIIQGLSFFIAADSLQYLRAWLWLGMGLITSLISTFISLRYLKDLMNARGRKQEGVKKWDLVLIITHFFILLVILPVIAGLDIVRFGNIPFGWLSFSLGMTMSIISTIIVLKAILENRHFEGLVRIQKDRDHTVISTGPYNIVRHPGYVGIILIDLSVPFILGSSWALIPSVICVLLIIYRTYREDLTLQAELTGYRDYTEKTRFRLVPGLW